MSTEGPATSQSTDEYGYDDDGGEETVTTLSDKYPYRAENQLTGYGPQTNNHCYHLQTHFTHDDGTKTQKKYTIPSLSNVPYRDIGKTNDINIKGHST